MPRIKTTIEKFLNYPHGKNFRDVATDPKQPFDFVIRFFDNRERQIRMEDAEVHHDRPPLAGVIREFESQPVIEQFLSKANNKRNTRFRQAVGVLVRMIMEARGWRKTGRKGSLGVRTSPTKGQAAHNSGGLSFWFIRAERYELIEGMPYAKVKDMTSPMRRLRSKKSSRSRK